MSDTATIDRLVLALAISTGTTEGAIRVAHGLPHPGVTR